MDACAVSCEVDDFVQTYLPNHGSNSFNKLIADLKKQKMLVVRAKSSGQGSSNSSQRPLYTHVLKPLKALFQSGSPNPNRVIKSMQAVVNAVRRALQRHKSTEVSEFFVREDDAYATATEASFTKNKDGPFKLYPTDIAIFLSIQSETESIQVCHLLSPICMALLTFQIV
jgi:hypothetical protein